MKIPRTRLETELLDGPVVPLFYAHLGDGCFFTVERPDVTGKRGGIVFNLSRYEFARIVIGDNGIFLYHFLKGIEGDLRSCGGEIVVRFLMVMLTDGLEL